MYETLGRMTGRSYEETVQVLTKGLKTAESQIRMETMIAFGKLKNSPKNQKDLPFYIYKIIS